MSTLTDRIIEGKVTIPSIPIIVQKVNALLQDENAGIGEIGRLIAQDAPMATKVLRIVNSAHYGLRERIISLEHASAVLGTRVLRNIVMQAGVIERFDHVHEEAGFRLQTLWRHSILCGQVAQSLRTISGAGLELSADEFYTCGLLHDLGQVVLMENMPERYPLVMHCVRMRKVTVHEAEQKILGFTHAEIGARVAHRWGLPEGVVSAIQYHHGPDDEIEADPCVGLVALANEVSRDLLEGDVERAIGRLTPELSSALGIPEARFESEVNSAAETMHEIEV